MAEQIIPTLNESIIYKGGGGTTDYEELTNKPKINDVELVGNKTSADLYLAGSADLVATNAKLTNEITTRGAKDDELKASIESEATTRETNDKTLETAIETEESKRIDADLVLQNHIDAEAKSRADADTSLTAEIAKKQDILTAGDYITIDGTTISANVPVATIMPTASAENQGKILQYIGDTTTDYTQGYFYKCVLPTEAEYDTSIKAPAKLKATVDTDTFVEAVSGVVGEYEFDFIGKPTGFIATQSKVAIIGARDADHDSGSAYCWSYTPPTSTSTQYYYTDTEYITSSTTLYLDTAFQYKAPYTISGIDRSTDEGFWSFDSKETPIELGDYGISVKSGKETVGDAIIVKLDSESSYYWDNIDVQPSNGSTIRVVQTTGTSTTDVMSQNAVTSLGEEFVFTLADKSTATMTIPVFAVTTTEAPVAVANEVADTANTVSDTVEEPVAVADAVVADTVEDPIIVEPETVETVDDVVVEPETVEPEVVETVGDDIVEDPTIETPEAEGVVENSETAEGE